jgi:hypothetical protein
MGHCSLPVSWRMRLVGAEIVIRGVISG